MGTRTMQSGLSYRLHYRETLSPPSAGHAESTYFGLLGDILSRSESSYRHFLTMPSRLVSDISEDHPGIK